MGKSKNWTADEHAALAQAWINASEDVGSSKVFGMNQDSDRFFAKVIDNLKALAPDSDTSGRHHNRDASAIQNQWNTKLAREVKKFNRALLKVLNSQSTWLLLFILGNPTS